MDIRLLRRLQQQGLAAGRDKDEQSQDEQARGHTAWRRYDTRQYQGREIIQPLSPTGKKAFTVTMTPEERQVAEAISWETIQWSVKDRIAFQWDRDECYIGTIIGVTMKAIKISFDFQRRVAKEDGVPIDSKGYTVSMRPSNIRILGRVGDRRARPSAMPLEKIMKFVTDVGAPGLRLDKTVQKELLDQLGRPGKVVQPPRARKRIAQREKVAQEVKQRGRRPAAGGAGGGGDPAVAAKVNARFGARYFLVLLKAGRGKFGAAWLSAESYAQPDVPQGLSTADVFRVDNSNKDLLADAIDEGQVQVRMGSGRKVTVRGWTQIDEEDMEELRDMLSRDGAKAMTDVGMFPDTGKLTDLKWSRI